MKIKKLIESKKMSEGISTTEPVVKFQGKSAYTLTKDKKWEVDFDEAGNIVARTRHGNPSYFKGHINDKVNDFPSTDEDNIILAARNQHGLKFGDKEVNEGYSHFEFTSGANPYIAKTKDEVERIKRSRGDSVKFVGNINGIDYYKVDDGEEKDLFSVDESFTNEDIVVALEKTPYTSFVVDEGDYIKIRGQWRKSTRMADSDYLNVRTFLNKKLGEGNFELVYENNTPRDDGKERCCVLRLKLKNNLDEAFKPSESGIQSVKVYNKYNYTIQELRVDNDKKTFERGNFTAGKADKKVKNRQEYEDIVDSLKELGYEEIPSDYNSLRNKTRKGVPTNESKSLKETYWIDNKNESELITKYLNNGEFDKLKKVQNGTNVIWKLKDDINEASYGGAFDIEDDQLFTRDDIEEASEDVLDHINETFDTPFYLGGTWFENGEWIVNVQTEDGFEFEEKVKVDFRKIRNPFRDLKEKYAMQMAALLIDMIKKDYYFEEELEEAFEGTYSDKFRSLIKENATDNELLASLCDDIIRYCPEEDLRDLWIRNEKHYVSSNETEELKESVTDAEPIETGSAVGVASILNGLIIDEYEAIEGYNTAIVNAEAEGYGDMVKVLTDIQAEENIHVGQLQELMKMVDPNADKASEGEQEASEQLNDETPIEG